MAAAMIKLGGILVIFLLSWTLMSAAASSVILPGNLVGAAFLPVHLSVIFLYFLLASTLTRALLLQTSRSGKGAILFYGLLVIALLSLAAALPSRSDTPSLVRSSLESAVLLFGAGLAGSLLSTAVRRLGELLPVCATASAADVMSVAIGPTESMIADITTYYGDGMQGVPPLVNTIIVKVGLPGTMMPVPLFGVTDWILVALLSASLLRLGKTDNLLASQKKDSPVFFPVSALGLFLALTMAWVTGVFIPAMAAISLLFIVLLATRYAMFTVLQRKDIAYTVVLPTVVILVLITFFRSSPSF